MMIGFLFILYATYKLIISFTGKNKREEGSTGSTRTLKPGHLSNWLLSKLGRGHANIFLKEGIEDRFTIESNF